MPLTSTSNSCSIRATAVVEQPTMIVFAGGGLGAGCPPVRGFGPVRDETGNRDGLWKIGK